MFIWLSQAKSYCAFVPESGQAQFRIGSNGNSGANSAGTGSGSTGSSSNAASPQNNGNGIGLTNSENLPPGKFALHIRDKIVLNCLCMESPIAKAWCPLPPKELRSLSYSFPDEVILGIYIEFKEQALKEWLRMFLRGMFSLGLK